METSKGTTTIKNQRGSIHTREATSNVKVETKKNHPHPDTDTMPAPVPNMAAGPAANRSRLAIFLLVWRLWREFPALTKIKGSERESMKPVFRFLLSFLRMVKGARLVANGCSTSVESQHHTGTQSSSSAFVQNSDQSIAENLRSIQKVIKFWVS